MDHGQGSIQFGNVLLKILLFYLKYPCEQKVIFDALIGKFLLRCYFWGIKGHQGWAFSLYERAALVIITLGFKSIGSDHSHYLVLRDHFAIAKLQTIEH